MKKKNGVPRNPEIQARTLDGVLVDDCDRHLLEDGRGWHSTKNNGYFKRFHRNGEKEYLLHRIIMNPPDGMFVDHINGNKKDNRRSNLRIVTKGQNQMNSVKQSKSKKTSPFKGVYTMKNCGRWYAKIKVDGKTIALGGYGCQVAAAFAYNRAARKHFGDYARVNFQGGDHA